jgi:hypothetical protein
MEYDDYPERKYTVVWLFLHAVVLLWIGVGSFIFAVTYPSPLGGVRLDSLIFLTLGLIALWLTYAHFSSTVKKKNLERWASFHVALSIYILVTYSQQPIFLTTGNLPTPPLLILLLLLPILVVVFLKKEGQS